MLSYLLLYMDTIFWFILFVGFLIIELFTLNLITIWFSAGALVTSIISLIKIGTGVEAAKASLVSPVFQIIIFLISSALLFLLFYSRIKNFVDKSKVKTNVEAMDGQIGPVVKAIETDEVGQVKINGQVWSAISYDNKPIALGEEVMVVKIEGVKAIVKKID